MSIYALTLPLFLNLIYLILNVLTGFTMSYFSIVYNVIACIYIVTAILMIKSDFVDQQKELIKIVEEQRVVKKEQREENKEKPDEKKDDQKEKEPEDDPIKNKDPDPDSEPEA